MPKQFEIEANYIEMHTITIEADTEEEAIKRFEEGEFDAEYFHGSELHEFIGIKEGE